MATRDTLLAARQNAENSIEYYENAIREREQAGAVSDNPWANTNNNQDLEREISSRQRRIAEIDRQLSELNEPNTLQQTDPSSGASRLSEIDRNEIIQQTDQSSEFAERDAEPVVLPGDERTPFPSAPGQLSESDPSPRPGDDAVPFPSAPGQIANTPGADPSVPLPPSELLAQEEEERLRNLPPSERLALERAQSDQGTVLEQIQQQNTVQGARAQRAGRDPADADWRVKLSLAPQANYLYKAQDPGILAPLQVTNGVIFPYTPQIDTVYYANYSNEDLTHSNYRAYFYQNSYPGEILVQATFTAQTADEADYMLAVIHFFRSATKMFYGQDEQRGTPPPVLYLDGLGEFQYNLHPCVISQFNYNLPDNVDYIRAAAPSRFNQPQSNSPNQETSFWAKTGASFLNQFDGTAARLAASALAPGAPAETLSTSPSEISDFVARNRISSTLQRPTYVPTELTLSLTLLPIQSRKQVSEQFSLRDFASGKLLKRGFW